MAGPPLILNWNLSDVGSAPFNLVLDHTGPTSTTTDVVTVDHYYRYTAAAADAPWQFLGSGVPGQDLDIPIALEPGEIVIKGVARTATGQTANRGTDAGDAQITYTIPASRPDSGSTGYVAGEAITVVDVIFVDLYDSGGGVMKFRKANATDDTKPCRAFILETVALGDTVPVYELRGQTIDGLSGITPGAVYFLSTTGGGRTTTPPSASGNIVQPIAVGKAGALEFDPQEPITLP
jgi:hypothetical protein